MYEVEDTSVSRFSALKNKTKSLVLENQQLKELLKMLHQKSDIEAFEIFSRLRTSDDPIAVLKQVKEADVLLPTPSSNTLAGDLSLQDLENAALRASPFTVPAHPWTAVAGDGIVSHLVCSFFKFDQVFLFPAIDPECFLQDMRTQDPVTSKYCSPFLLNAICALRAVGHLLLLHIVDLVDLPSGIGHQRIHKTVRGESQHEHEHQVSRRSQAPSRTGMRKGFSIDYSGIIHVVLAYRCKGS